MDLLNFAQFLGTGIIFTPILKVRKLRQKKNRYLG